MGYQNLYPFTENHPQNPINPYGATKLMVERILSDFDVAYGFKSVRFRYFNAAGANPSGLAWRGSQPRNPFDSLGVDDSFRSNENLSQFSALITPPLMVLVFEIIFTLAIWQTLIF